MQILHVTYANNPTDRILLGSFWCILT